MSEKNSHNPFLRHVICKHLRCDTTPGDQDINQAGLYFEEVRLHSLEDPIQGPYVMPLVTLTTRPCKWSLGGGCGMCGYHLGAATQDVSEENLVNQTKNIIKRLSPKIYPSLVFTSNGSFLDNDEVPDSIRPTLLQALCTAGFRFLISETRPEHITTERLNQMVEAFCPETANTNTTRHRISLSMGLESANDFILRYCINKGACKNDYQNAFSLLSDQRFYFDCYVLLGKPFLTAGEDIDDAIETIRFAVDNGAEYVFVMVVNLTKQSLVSHLHAKGRYQLPSLWRAVTLLESLPDKYRRAVLVKGISHAPVSPLCYAKTCTTCTGAVQSGINFWNMTGDIGHLRSLPQCSCKEAYNREELSLEEAPLPLPQRIQSEYRHLADDFGISSTLLPHVEGT